MSTAPAAPSAPPPLKGGQLVLATIAVALATFMNVLDSSIANVAIPTISGNLGVSVDEGTWVVTVFAAANAVSIPLTGWLTQRIGQIKLFVGAILLFVISSWLCGLAPTLPVLLAARVLQGAVAGPLIPLSQAILLGSYPKEKASMALSLWAMTAVVGPIAGPALGGWITDSYSWSWIFYINIPVGLFAASVTWFIYRKRESATRKAPIDTVGLALLIAWVASLQIMLDKGRDLDWFSSPLIVWLGIIALIAFALFVVWELTDANPVVDLRLFAGRNFFGGTVAISVAYGFTLMAKSRIADLRSVFSPVYAQQRRTSEIPYVESFDYMNHDPLVTRVLILDRSVPAYYSDRDYVKPFGQWGELLFIDASTSGDILRRVDELHPSHILDVQSEVSDFCVPPDYPGLVLVFDRPRQKIYKVTSRQ